MLVLGGAGFIGSKVSEFSYENHETTVIDVVKPKHNNFNTFIKGDITMNKTFEKLTDKFDVIFDFASPSSMRMYDFSPVDLPTLTVRGFLNILEYSKKIQISNLIFPSSCTVYGNTTGDLDRKIDPLNIYASLKYFYENMGKVYSRYFKTTALRIFMGYGPGEELKGDIASPISLFLNKIMDNSKPEIWGDGTQSRDVVYIDDIAEVAIKATKQKTNWDVFDVGTGSAISFNSILKIIFEITGKTMDPKYVNPKAIGYQKLTKADPTVFISILGRPPINVKDGIKKFYDHMMH